MATGSGHSSASAASAASTRAAVVGALFAGLVVFALVMLVAFDGRLEAIWVGLAAGFVAAVITLVGIRSFLKPQLARIEDAVSKIQGLVEPVVDDLEAETPVEALPANGRGDADLVQRLEITAERVAAKLEELRKIENYRQEYIGDVSHELQTPIFAVQGFAETLLEGALDDPQVNRPFVEKILRHSQRLSNLVNDLSHISQIESGSVKMKVEPFKPGMLIDETLDALESAAKAGQISLYRFAAPEVAHALGDRMRIRQVIDNLVVNGIKYNEPGGRVEVAVRAGRSGKVRFSVTDDGIGIAPEYYQRITERFFRIDKSRSRERGGTGLGLAIVKHILEAHGTTLMINSQPGRGSTFSFELDSTSDFDPAEID